MALPANPAAFSFTTSNADPRPDFIEDPAFAANPPIFPIVLPIELDTPFSKEVAEFFAVAAMFFEAFTSRTVSLSKAFLSVPVGSFLKEEKVLVTDRDAFRAAVSTFAKPETTEFFVFKTNKFSQKKEAAP